MKKLIIGLLIFCIHYYFPQQTYVPDDNFEQVLINLGYDSVLDNYVTTANINTVSELKVNNKNINDLKGIEDFTALKRLDCSQNNLSSLNTSGNPALEKLECYLNQITELDFSKNNLLNDLICSDNLLTYLDLRKTEIKYLVCSNIHLKSVDIRNRDIDSIEKFISVGSPKLRCVIADNVVIDSNLYWVIDSFTHLVLNEAECAFLATNEINNTKLSIYPNPVRDYLFVRNFKNIYALEILDLTGKLIKTFKENKEVYSVNDLEKGIYVLKIFTQEGIIIKKILKE